MGSALGLGAMQKGCEEWGSLGVRGDAQGQPHCRRCPARCITAGRSAVGSSVLPPVLIPPRWDNRAVGSTGLWFFPLFLSKARTLWISLCLRAPQSHPWGAHGLGPPWGAEGVEVGAGRRSRAVTSPPLLVWVSFCPCGGGRISSCWWQLLCWSRKECSRWLAQRISPSSPHLSISPLPPPLLLLFFSLLAFPRGLPGAATPPRPASLPLHPQPLFLGRKPNPYLPISEEESPHLPGEMEALGKGGGGGGGEGLGHIGCPQWEWGCGYPPP